MSDLGNAYNNVKMWDKAVPLLRDSLELHIKQLGPDHHDTLNTMYLLGVAYGGSGQAAMAVPLLEDAIEKRTRLPGDADGKELALDVSELGVALSNAGKAKQAIPIHIQAVDLVGRQFGAEHQNTLTATRNLGIAYLQAEQFADGVALLEKLLETCNRLHGVEHPEALKVGAQLVAAYRLDGKSEEERRLALSRVQILRSQSDEIQLASALAVASDALQTYESFTDAEPLARECVQIRAAKMPDTWLHSNAQSLLGGALVGQQKYAEAESLLLQAFEGLDLHKAEVPPNAHQRHIKATLDRLIQLYESTNRPDEVLRWKAKLPENVAKQPISK